MLMKPCQKIKVIESDKKCKTGSTGYLVGQRPVDSYNAWYVGVVFTRFGKKGMPRMEFVNIVIPIIDISGLEESDRQIIEVVQFAELLSPMPHPDDLGRKRRRYSTPLPDSKIEPIDPGVKDLMDMKPLEFLAYATAMSLSIRALKRKASSLHLSMRLQPPYHVNLQNFTEGGYRLDQVSSPDVGLFVMISWLYDRSNKNTIYMDNILHVVEDPDVRYSMWTKMMRTNSECVEAVKKQEEGNIRAYERMGREISDVLKFYNDNPEELDRIKEYTKSLPKWKKPPSKRIEQVQKERKIKIKLSGKVCYKKTTIP